ncbi:hypothetical protein ACNKU7_05655 [Microbulbifer sp. SA54]|uniref:hypothetical protein n=1 Tax=Microbulbifer sp. SA54 TaxID=3401577 RepID=UPI003AAE303A
MKNSALSREELFALVWDRPSKEVARELGISDVALGKLCKRLQVPKPPRGYWAKIAAGRKPRKPPLQAYRTEVEKRLNKQATSTTPIRLSKLQLEFLKLAFDELAATGVELGELLLAYDGIRSIPSELAAQVLIVLQTRYETWVKARSTASSMNGAISSLSNLVGKLLPYAKEQLLVFHRQPDERYSRSMGPSISIRATEDFLGRIAHLSRLARTNGCAYVAVDMSALEYAWSVNQISSPRAYSKAKAELCVSSNEVWIRVQLDNSWSHDQFETVRLPLREICPIDLVPAQEQRLAGKISRSGIQRPYAERLQILQEAQVFYEGLMDAAYDMDKAIPNERLALFDRLCFSKGEAGPFVNARRAWRSLETDLEQWGEELESEAVVLCQDILGIRIGDIVLVESGKSTVRLQVERMSVYSSDGRVIFGVWGARFRKDGLPGKRSEHFSIVVEND